MRGAILLEHKDGKLYQVHVSEKKLTHILYALMQEEPDGQLKVYDKPIETIELQKPETTNNKQETD